MALIVCPECGAQVSDRAPSCPKCAYPFSPVAVSVSKNTQTIEQTGKRWKLQKVLSAFCIFGSFFFVMVGAASQSSGLITLGVLGVIVGIVWYVVAKLMSWWHHG